jgi:hypothetical protein
MKIILFVVVISVILGIAFLGLAIQIILRKRNKSLNFHLKRNKGITSHKSKGTQLPDKSEKKEEKE